jgi:hypothetical protein
MPRAFDRYQFTPDFSPLDSIGFNVGDTVHDITEAVEQALLQVATLVINTISDLIGLDLTPFLASLVSVVENLEIIFGSLNPLSGSFSPDDAMQALMNMMFDVGITFPVAMVQNLAGWLTGFAAGVPILDQLIGALGGTVGSGLTGLANTVLATVQDVVQALIDAIFGGLTGSGRVGNLLTDIIDALRSIPAVNVVGIGGPANIGAALQDTWNQLVGGLVGVVGGGAGLSDLFNVAADIASRASLGLFSWDILGIRSNKSLNAGLLPTSESNIGLDKVALQSAAPTIPVTQSTAITAFQRISEAGTKGVVSWLGAGVTNITDCYVNVYLMATDGSMALQHQSANVVGLLSSTMQYNVYSLPTAINVEAGSVFGIEIAVRGTGTHNIAGSTSWLPEHPSVYPKKLSAVRNSGTTGPPTSILEPAVVYSSSVPFIEFGVSADLVAIPHSPVLNYFNTAGSLSFPIPAWVNHVEVVAIGGGGGGHVGGTWGIAGEGGDNGPWAVATWVRGTDYTGSPSISITVGAGGGGGGSSPGGHGGSSIASITGHTVTAVGGAGANNYAIIGTDEYVGESPGNQVYDGITYVGGVAQRTHGSGGAPPGGGGAGGNYISFQRGGGGAIGGVWIRFIE